MDFEDILKILATNTHALHYETKPGIKNLEQKMTKLTNTMGKLEAQGKLSSQKNPKHNTCAITLIGRTGKISYRSNLGILGQKDVMYMLV